MSCTRWTLESFPLLQFYDFHVSSEKSLSCVQLFATSWTVALQAPPSMGFSRQEYWSGLPFPFPGNLPDPGIEHRSPGLQADSLLSEPPGKNLNRFIPCLNGLLTNFHLRRKGGSRRTVFLMLLLLKSIVSTEGCRLGEFIIATNVG